MEKVINGKDLLASCLVTDLVFGKDIGVGLLSFFT